MKKEKVDKRLVKIIEKWLDENGILAGIKGNDELASAIQKYYKKQGKVVRRIN